MARLVALLRAVNVGGRKLPMAELRALCGELGWKDVETYIQSGNIVFTAAGPGGELERRLEEAIEARFGMGVPVMVRTASQWAVYVAANPFPKAAEEEPNRLMLLVSKNDPNGDAAGKLMERARGGESVKAAGGALWFHFPEGVGTSKLTPDAIDKAAGSPSTSRNWRTVVKLQEMAAA
jgi:uncharacterized protein (DUF1697 family)